MQRAVTFDGNLIYSDIEYIKGRNITFYFSGPGLASKIRKSIDNMINVIIFTIILSILWLFLLKNIYYNGCRYILKLVKIMKYIYYGVNLLEVILRKKFYNINNQIFITI